MSGDNVKNSFHFEFKVYRAKNDLQTALKCLQRANEILPNEEDILKELTTITSLIQKQKVSERELARRMFNGPKSDKEEAGRKKGKSTKASLFFHHKLYIIHTYAIINYLHV